MALVAKHHVVRALVQNCVTDVNSVDDDTTRNAAMRVFTESLSVIQLLALRDPNTIEIVFHPQQKFLNGIAYP